ncbi:MAG: hypothetical protein ACJAQW_001280 [Paracoccaceae bacterium]|jgi:hypothetical protein
MLATDPHLFEQKVRNDSDNAAIAVVNVGRDPPGKVAGHFQHFGLSRQLS